MTQALETASGAVATAESPPLNGPIVAAIGGVDPNSVLRATRIVAPASAAGVIAVAVLPPYLTSVPGESSWIIPTGYEEERYVDAKAQLVKQLDAFGGAATTWTRTVVRGSPSNALAQLAREEHAALLVVGIGRHRPLDRIFGGETALRIVQRAPCPVLVVHPDFDGPFHDVVIATDFSAASLAAARAAVPMLSSEATIHLVHIWQPSDSFDGRRPAADEAYEASLPESLRRAIELLAFPPSMTVKTVVREGWAAEGVLDYAKTHHADLITAGRHGKNLLQRFFVGSQTTAMLRAADRSLLIAPEPPFAERDHVRLVLTGSTESSDPTEWESQLRGVSQRNSGRSTVVEVDDVMFGAQVIESGYVLLGVAYDPTTKRVEITLGDAAQGARRVTRMIGVVDSVAIEADASGRDLGVRITHGGGQTALTFVGE